MPKQYTVNEGDGISRIAYDNGFFWETVWQDGANAQLRSIRDHPEVLLPGDVVTIPDKRQKQASVNTDHRLRMRLKGVPARLQVRLIDPDGKPRAGLAYEIEIDGQKQSGKTDGAGGVRMWVPPNAVQGKLRLTETHEEYDIALGCIDPLDTIKGAQAVLYNLGNVDVQASGEMDDATRTALTNFQRMKRLPVTGSLDGPTVAALKQAYFG